MGIPLARSSALLVLLFLGAACVPADPLEGIERIGPAACKSDSACAEGEICNPGSLRCVADVSVGPDEVAGSAWYVVGQGPAGAQSGSTKNVYAKVNYKGQDYVLDDIFAVNLAGHFLVNLTQALGGGRFSVMLDFRTPPTRPGALEIHDGVDPTKTGPAAWFGAFDEEFLSRTYVTVTEGGTLTFEELPHPLEPLEIVSFSFRGKMGPIGPANAQIRSTPCGVDERGRKVGLYDPIDLTCVDDLGDANVFGAFDCLYAVPLPDDGGNATMSWKKPPGILWPEGDPVIANQEGTCRATVLDSGEVQAVALVSYGPSAPGKGVALELRAARDKISAGADLDLAGVNVRLYRVSFDASGRAIVEDVGRLGSGRLKVQRFESSGARQRLFFSLRGTLGGSLAEGESCDVASDDCRGGLLCQASWLGDGSSWCMTPCAEGQETCADGRQCLWYMEGDQKRFFCGHIYGELQTGCNPDPRRHHVCGGDGIECREINGSPTCVDPCSAADPCTAPRTCTAGGYCLRTVATFQSCAEPGTACAESVDVCQPLSFTGGGESRLCLEDCRSRTCPAGQHCEQMAFCARTIPDYSSCGEADWLAGRWCRPGGECSAAYHICLGPCGSGCGTGQHCDASGYCARSIATYGRCSAQERAQGYLCRPTDVCVNNPQGTTSYCYPLCGTGYPRCTRGTCTELTNGQHACLPEG